MSKLSEKIEQYLIEGMMFPLGSGEKIKDYWRTYGTLSTSDRNKLNTKLRQGATSKPYYDTIGAVVKAIFSAVGKDVTFIMDDNSGETWEGSFTGTVSLGKTEHFKIEFVKDGKVIKNSRLIINIYKENRDKNPYELNAYFS
jgi:hypothetical protein